MTPELTLDAAKGPERNTMEMYVRTFWACPFCESAELDVTFVVRCKNCGAVANLDSWNSRSKAEYKNVLALRNAPTITTTQIPPLPKEESNPPRKEG